MSTKPVSVRIPKELATRLDSRAADGGQSRSATIKTALARWLDREEQSPFAEAPDTQER